MISILLIEDDEAVSTSLQVMLESKGYDVHVGGDCESGLRLLDEKKPAAVVLDMYLPGCEGMDIYRMIIERPDCPTVLLLSSLTRDQMISAIGDRFDIDEKNIFSKPIDPGALISRIAEIAAG